MKSFEASRRLTGANLYFGVPAVVLEPRGPLADDTAAHAHWALRVRHVCAALGWPEPRPVARLRAYGGGQLVALAFAAPESALYTATEVNEWAWERSVAAAVPGGDLQAAGFDVAHAGLDDDAAAAGAFAAAARRETSAPLLRLEAAARRHRVACLSDDDTVSLGSGSGSRSWPRAALPLPMDVPWNALHDVSTVVVTGSNGKTTTTRLLAAIATAAGRVAGYCSTEGVFVGGQERVRDDYAGPAGARWVLRDRSVQAAILETARGGLLRRGLALRRADVAVVTNVSADHLGEYGVADADDIAEAKLVVAHAVADAGTLVLNAGDAVLMRMAERLPHALRARRALFAADHNHPRLAALRACGGTAGGDGDSAPWPPGPAPVADRAEASALADQRAPGATCGVCAGRLLLSAEGRQHDLGDIAAMPLAVGGAATYNVENLAAAALAGWAAGFGIDAIRATLSSFGSRPGDNPGRLERWPHRGATVLVDYAHNPDGLTQLLRVARSLQPRRLGLLLGQAGDRDDGAIRELARAAAAFAPDCIVVKELPGMLRGRAVGDVSDLLEAELQAAGVPAACRVREPDEEAAARLLMAWAQAGDVVVLPLHTGPVRERVVATCATASRLSGR